jgi:hypothetical protein
LEAFFVKQPIKRIKSYLSRSKILLLAVGGAMTVLMASSAAATEQAATTYSVNCPTVTATSQTCYYNFSDGPQGYVEMLQKMQTVKVTVCAAGRPSHFKSFKLSDTLSNKTTGSRISKKTGSISLGTHRKCVSRSLVMPPKVHGNVDVVLTLQLKPFTVGSEHWSGVTLSAKIPRFATA